MDSANHVAVVLIDGRARFIRSSGVAALVALAALDGA
jgi:hypothetical protein